MHVLSANLGATNCSFKCWFMLQLMVFSFANLRMEIPTVLLAHSNLSDYSQFNIVC